jgi:hypothetical protein
VGGTITAASDIESDGKITAMRLDAYGPIQAIGDSADMSCSQYLSVGTGASIGADLSVGGTITAGDKISTTSRADDAISSDGGITAHSITCDGDIHCSSMIGSGQFRTTYGWGDSISTEGGIEANGITLSGQPIGVWRDVQNYFSQTITHRTNIIDYDDSKIGCFAETTGELADVYDVDGVAYVPTLSRSCDAIVKVRPTNTLSIRVLGIIADSTTLITHGDCLVVVKQGPSYQLGQLLVPDISGVCRIATEEDKRTIMFEGLPRVRITGLVPGQEFVLAFMS